MPIFENFSIDNIIFRPPNKITEDETSGDFLKKIVMDDGSVRAYKSVSGLKFKYDITFDFLPFSEYEVLKGYLNNGFWQVSYEGQEYHFDNLFLIEPSSWGFTFGGGRKDVKLTLTQQEAPSYD